MTSNPEHGPKRRVVIAIDDSPLTEDIIETSARLASGLSAELLAFLVEQDDLMAAAGLSITSLTSLQGGDSLPFDAISLRRTLRVRARAIETRLAQIAESLKVPWSFRSGATSVLDETLRTVTPHDVVAFHDARAGRSGRVTATTAFRLRQMAGCSVFVVRQARVSQRCVLALTMGAPETTALGAGLSRAKSKRLLVLPVAREGNDAPDLTAATGIESSLAKAGGHSATVVLPAIAADRETVLSELQRLNPAFVVVDRAVLDLLDIQSDDLTDRLRLDGLAIAGGAPDPSPTQDQTGLA